MNSDKARKIDRRDFLIKTGVTSLAAATLGFTSVAKAGTEGDKEIIKKHWQKKQKLQDQVEI